MKPPRAGLNVWVGIVLSHPWVTVLGAPTIEGDLEVLRVVSVHLLEEHCGCLVVVRRHHTHGVAQYLRVALEYTVGSAR